jgi:hypothetical protein
MLETLPHYAAILTNLASVKSRVATLAHSFEHAAPRTAADDAVIDLFTAQAAQLLQAAAALKDITYVPPDLNP